MVQLPCNNSGGTEKKREQTVFDDDEDIIKPRWYLPLHIVELRGKTRVCHDARAATDGICLNDLLVGGPNLMNSLMDTLMRF